MNFKNVFKNVIKIYTKTHQIALLFSKFLEVAYFKINTKRYQLYHVFKTNFRS